jgi:hypothetical protein
MMWLSDQASRGAQMIVPMTAPERDASVWVDYSPHLQRITCAPKTKSYVIASVPVSVEGCGLPNQNEIEAAELEGVPALEVGTRSLA